VFFGKLKSVENAEKKFFFSGFYACMHEKTEKSQQKTEN